MRALGTGRLGPRAPGLPQRRAQSADEGQHRERRRRHAGPVPADERGGPVAERRRPRLDGEPVEVTADVAGERLGRRVPAFGLGPERLEHDPVEVASETPRQPSRRRPSRRSDLVGRGRGRLACRFGPRLRSASGRARPVGGARIAGPAARQQLVEQDAQPVHVRRGRDVPPLDLLRSRVLGREQAAVGRGDRNGHARIVAEELGQPEVEQLGVAAPVGLGDEHVRRLEVAVDHEPAVGVLDRVADLEEQAEPGVDAEPLAVGVGRDRLALDELHRQPRLAVGGHAAPVEPGDVGVAERGERLPLDAEPPRRLVPVDAPPDQLDGHVPLELAVLPPRPVDGPHPTRPEQVEEAVRPDRLDARDLFVRVRPECEPERVEVRPRVVGCLEKPLDLDPDGADRDAVEVRLPL